MGSRLGGRRAGAPTLYQGGGACTLVELGGELGGWLRGEGLAGSAGGDVLLALLGGGGSLGKREGREQGAGGGSAVGWLAERKGSARVDVHNHAALPGWLKCSAHYRASRAQPQYLRAPLPARLLNLPVHGAAPCPGTHTHFHSYPAAPTFMDASPPLPPPPPPPGDASPGRGDGPRGVTCDRAVTLSAWLVRLSSPESSMDCSLAS